MQKVRQEQQDHDINLIIDEERWQSQPLPYNKLIPAIIEIVLKIELISDFVELNIRLTNDEVMQQLNKDFLNLDKPTNVLSFPAHHDESINFFANNNDLLPLGDIAFGYETIDREANEQGKTFKDHFIHLLIHGTLHVLGFDHLTDDEAEEMEALEIHILKGLGINNPYIEKENSLA